MEIAPENPGDAVESDIGRRALMELMVSNAKETDYNQKTSKGKDLIAIRAEYEQLLKDEAAENSGPDHPDENKIEDMIGSDNPPAAEAKTDDVAKSPAPAKSKQSKKKKKKSKKEQERSEEDPAPKTPERRSRKRKNKEVEEERAEEEKEADEDEGMDEEEVLEEKKKRAEHYERPKKKRKKKTVDYGGIDSDFSFDEVTEEDEVILAKRKLSHAEVLATEEMKVDRGTGRRRTYEESRQRAREQMQQYRSGERGTPVRSNRRRDRSSDEIIALQERELRKYAASREGKQQHGRQKSSAPPEDGLPARPPSTGRIESDATSQHSGRPERR